MSKRRGINERIEDMPSVKEKTSPTEKARAMAEVYRTTSNRLGATGAEKASSTAARRAAVLDKIAKGKPDAWDAAIEANKREKGWARQPTPAMMTKQRAREDYRATFGKDAAKSLTTSQMDNAVARQRNRAAEHARLGNAVQSINAPASRGLDIEGMVRQRAAELTAKTNPNVDAVRNLDAKAMSAKRKVFDAPDQAKIIDARNATARSLAEQAKFTGVDAGRGAAARDLVARNTSDLSRLGNDAHMGTTSHVPAPPAPPSAPKPPMLSRLGEAYGKAQTGLTVIAAGAQGAHAFHDAREHGASVGAAAYEGMKAAAPSAALTVAHPVGSALANAGKAMTAHAAKILDGASALDSSIATAGVALDSPLLIAMTDTGLGVGLGMGGWASRGVGATLKAAGKVALPAAAAVGAYQGAKEDTNTVRGAGRGVVRSLDPTGIVTGLTGHGPGLAERVYDAAFGKAQARFKAAAAPADSQVAEGKRGWANPKVQAAAQAAKGRTFTGQE